MGLTEVGHLVYRYAHEIFMLGQELTDTLQGRPAGRSLTLLVGVADVLPKLVAYRLIEPALLRPVVVGEFEDSALLKVFGQAGAGVFAVPSIVAEDARQQYKVRKLGEPAEIVERWYAISVERRVQHPAVVAICHAARSPVRIGHRIRIEVSSSDFPRFTRNLDTGGNNYDETEGIVGAQHPAPLSTITRGR